LRDYLLGKKIGAGFDINDDGNFDIADLIRLIDLMSTSTFIPSP